MANNGSDDEDDPWDAFGDDDDDDDDDQDEKNDGNDDDAAQKGKSSCSASSSFEAADRVASHLAKVFFWNKKNIKLGILVYENSATDAIMRQQEQETWETTLTARGFAVTLQVVMMKSNRINDTTDDDDTMILCNKQEDQPALLDAMVLAWSTTTTTMITTDKEKDWQKLVCGMQKDICPGGVLIVPISLPSSLSKATMQNDDTTTTTTSTHVQCDRDVWKIDEAEMLYEYPPSFQQETDNNMDNKKNAYCSTSLWAITKYACPIQSSLPTCTWLPLHYNVQDERQRVSHATICLSADEITQSKMVETSIQQAVQALQEYGYCIVPRLLFRDLAMIHAWSHAALEDLHDAATILKQRDHVDLLNPHESHHEPASYREMSMREDFRMDLRHGPRLSQLRARGAGGTSHIMHETNNDSLIDIVVDNDDENDGNLPWIVKATTPLPDAITCTNSQKNDTNSVINDDDKFHAGYFLRGHVDILEIVRRTMNPTAPPSTPAPGDDDDPNKRSLLSRGNFGRYNFAGSGPDGSFQNLRVSPVGAIISLPGSADQAIHADTPHLFEHVSCLPAHYINVFTPGISATPGVGQTALVHASHTLEFCARFMNDNGKHLVSTDKNKSDDYNKTKKKTSWKDFLVRPSLDLGDVLLFDCRILHFGLANSSCGGGGGGDNGATTTTTTTGSGVERPLLYTNMTQHWFHDPKNWQDQRPIFEG